MRKESEKQFYGKLGPASPVKRIDPKTGNVVEVIDPAATKAIDGTDQDLIGIQFAYVDGHVCEVIGVAATPGAIRYRDLTNGIEGVLLSVYVRRAKQRQHLENQHLENMELEGRNRNDRLGCKNVPVSDSAPNGEKFIGIRRL